MIHKILFSLITVFWILGISQGYVLQGQDDDFIEITVTFDERNRLDIKDMMDRLVMKTGASSCNFCKILQVKIIGTET